MIQKSAANLIPLFPEEEANYLQKETWQRRAIAWFGLATGLSLSAKFARVYYEFVSARHIVPGAADSEYFDLEWTALMGVVVGLIIALIPVIIAFYRSKRPPEGFAARKFMSKNFGHWLLGFLTILISVGIILLGIGGFFPTKRFGWIIGFESGEFITMFGALLVGTPLLIEGLWTLYTYRRGIQKVLVLRKGKWSNE